MEEIKAFLCLFPTKPRLFHKPLILVNSLRTRMQFYRLISPRLSKWSPKGEPTMKSQGRLMAKL